MLCRSRRIDNYYFLDTLAPMNLPALRAAGRGSCRSAWSEVVDHQGYQLAILGFAIRHLRLLETFRVYNGYEVPWYGVTFTEMP
jgi:hypothetical protein